MEERDSNIHIYCIAIMVVTLVSIILGIYFSFTGNDAASEALILVSIIILLVLMVEDRKRIEKARPDRLIFNVIAVLFLPWYLYKRAIFLEDNQRFLWIWLGMLMIFFVLI